MTDKWLPAAMYIKIFCISSMFIMIATGNCETIKAMGRSDVFLKMEIIKKCCYFVTIAVFLIFSESPIALAVSSIVCTIIAILVNTYPNRKLLDYSYRLQLADLIPNLVIASIMSIIVYSMNLIEINKLLLLILQVIVGIITYISLSVLTKNTSFFYVVNLIRDYLGMKS